MSKKNETDEQIRARLGLDPHAAVVPSEAWIRHAGFQGKRFSPDLPGAPGRARWPRWTEVLSPESEPTRVALQRLQAQWKSEAVTAGKYAIGYVAEGKAGDGVSSEIIIVDARVPRVLAEGRVDGDGCLLPRSWEEYQQHRRYQRLKSYRKRAAASLDPAQAGKGVVKLLKEAEQLLARLRILIDQTRSAERRLDMSELVLQVEEKLTTASTKYKCQA